MKYIEPQSNNRVLNNVKNLVAIYLLCHLHLDGGSNGWGFVTHWPLEDLIMILKVYSLNLCYWWSSWAQLLKLLSGVSHRTHLLLTLIVRFIGPTWAHLGPTGPRWPHFGPMNLAIWEVNIDSDHGLVWSSKKPLHEMMLIEMCVAIWNP